MAFDILMSDSFDASAEQLKTFKAACHKRYPHAAIFRDIESAALKVTVAEAVAPASWNTNMLIHRSQNKEIQN